MNGSDDVRLVRAVLDGDTSSFAEIVKRYERYVFAVISRHVGAEDVEELAHDTFVHAYTSLDRYRGDAPLRHWLATIAVRRCYDFYRSRARRERTFTELRSADAQEDAASTSQALELSRVSADRGFARELLRRALAELSPEDRMVVVLVHVEERPVREAAALLGWSVPNVKVRAFRARKQLRKYIEALESTTEKEDISDEETDRPQ